MEHTGIGLTTADLQRLDAEEKWIEVEQGIIVEGEHDVTFLHLIIIQNLFRILDAHVRKHQLGSVYMHGARYILAGTPDHIQRAYKPDFSFLRAGRIPKDFDWSGDYIGAPDLAVEVASPGQTNAILLRKISHYLEAGSGEAWLIYPNRKALYQYHPDAEEPSIYRAGEIINTESLFPGLRLNMDLLFVTDSE
jgi:Uma2 family endonuclease